MMSESHVRLTAKMKAACCVETASELLTLLEVLAGGQTPDAATDPYDYRHCRQLATTLRETAAQISACMDGV